MEKLIRNPLYAIIYFTNEIIISWVSTKFQYNFLPFKLFIDEDKEPTPKLMTCYVIDTSLEIPSSNLTNQDRR